MKKFFTVIPLQLGPELMSFHYEAIGNSKLEMDGETKFPILTALNGYAEEGDEIRVIAVATDVDATLNNREFFEKEVQEICRKKNLSLPKGVEYILIPQDEQVSQHVSTFQKLIDYVDDDDELFACVTYGTKPMSMVLMMAVQYAYRIKRNASISCIVYGEIVRPERDRNTWYGKVYDLTALVQVDEMVRILADRGVEDPKKVLDFALSL